MKRARAWLNEDADIDVGSDRPGWEWRFQLQGVPRWQALALLLLPSAIVVALTVVRVMQ